MRSSIVVHSSLCVLLFGLMMGCGGEGSSSDSTGGSDTATTGSATTDGGETTTTDGASTDAGETATTEDGTTDGGETTATDDGGETTDNAGTTDNGADTATDETGAIDETGETDTSEVTTAGGEGTEIWGAVCTDNAECEAPTNSCVKQPGSTEGYCSIACPGGGSECTFGNWSCNVVGGCASPLATWCGPPEEIAASGGFVEACE